VFNRDQRDYMRSLDEMPPETKCYCGWYALGSCPHCPKDKTCADKLKTDPYWIKRLAQEESHE
jgi:hypothetical protein